MKDYNDILLRNIECMYELEKVLGRNPKFIHAGRFEADRILKLSDPFVAKGSSSYPIVLGSSSYPIVYITYDEPKNKYIEKKDTMKFYIVHFHFEALYLDILPQEIHLDLSDRPSEETKNAFLEGKVTYKPLNTNLKDYVSKH